MNQDERLTRAMFTLLGSSDFFAFSDRIYSRDIYSQPTSPTIVHLTFFFKKHQNISHIFENLYNHNTFYNLLSIPKSKLHCRFEKLGIEINVMYSVKIDEFFFPKKLDIDHFYEIG